MTDERVLPPYEVPTVDEARDDLMNALLDGDCEFGTIKMLIDDLIEAAYALGQKEAK